MRVLYIEHYAGSPYMGMEYRPYYLSKEWIKKGHKVTIIAGDFSHLRRNNPVIEEDFYSEVIDGIEYIWVKTGQYEGNGVRRAFTMLRFVRKLLQNAKRIADRCKPNVVIASSTYPLDTYPAQRIAKYASAKYVHEVHDMWPSTLYEVGGMSKLHPFVALLQIAENSAYRNCDKCVALLPYSKEYMVEHGLDPEKYINIQNGVVLEEWSEYDQIPELHKKFFLEHKNKFIVGYFGGHALSNALDRCIDVAKKYLSSSSETIFVFVGDGVEKAKLVERVKDERINNVHFLPPVNKKAIPDLLRYFDCTLMAGEPSSLYRFGLSLNKMYDSMMAGIPIICAFDTPQTLVGIYGCGVECSSDVDEIVHAIQYIQALTQDEREAMGKKGYNAIKENFTYEKLAEKFMNSI